MHFYRQNFKVIEDFNKYRIDKESSDNSRYFINNKEYLKFLDTITNEKYLLNELQVWHNKYYKDLATDILMREVTGRRAKPNFGESKDFSNNITFYNMIKDKLEILFGKKYPKLLSRTQYNITLKRDEKIFIEKQKILDKEKEEMERLNPTPSIILGLNRKKMKGVIGTGLNRGGKLSIIDLKGLLKASYDKNIKNINGFIQDEELSTDNSKVFVNNKTGQAVVTHKGTQGISDWLNNAVYGVGGIDAYKLTPRFKEAEQVQLKAEAKYGANNISTIGHSQGALQAELLGKNSHEIITLNKATRPNQNVKQKNQTDIASSGDLVSSLNPFKGKSDVIIPSKGLNILKEHNINILDRLNPNLLVGI